MRGRSEDGKRWLREKLLEFDMGWGAKEWRYGSRRKMRIEKMLCAFSRPYSLSN